MLFVLNLFVHKKLTYCFIVAVGFLIIYLIEFNSKFLFIIYIPFTFCSTIKLNIFVTNFTILSTNILNAYSLYMYGYNIKHATSVLRCKCGL